ncbi:LysM peptidoglycan-binding domain-containing protein [Jatrophihabitans sp. YIM 134969]
MRRGLRAVGALVILCVLVAGIPVLLALTIGDPFAGWADLRVGDLTDVVIVDLLALVVWIAWAQFALSVVLECVSVTRQVPSRRHIPLVPGASQHLAHVLIASVLLLGAASTTVVIPTHATASTPVATSTRAVATPAVTTVPSGTGSTSSIARDFSGAIRQQAASSSYIVPTDGDGPDTYWDIAAAYCGGGENWKQVWDLNRGRTQTDGTVMNDPGLLRPGWAVALPGPAVTTPEAPVEPVTVRVDDTLSGIAEAHGLSDWHRAWDASQGMAEPGGQTFDDPDLIRPGWIINVPTTATPTAVPPVARPAAPIPPQQAPPTSSVPVVPAEPATQAPPMAAQRRASSPESTSSVHSSDRSMIAFAGGGALLAGLALAALVRYRRRQFRWRSAGRAIAATPPHLVDVERQVLAAGGAAAGDVVWLTEALRSLVHALSGQESVRLPDVVAVRMTDDVIELILTSPQQNPPEPWVADEPATRWSISRSDPLGYAVADQQYHFAPYPTLASVGYTSDGEHWMLDLERVSAMSLSGDPQRCLGLARFLAAELAHNSWSEMLQVTLVGFGRELADINPDRLSHTEDFADAIGSLRRQLGSVRNVIDSVGVDVLAGRLRNIAGDAWAPHVLLIAPHLAEDAVGLEDLLAEMRGQRARTAVALVLAGAPDLADGTRWQLTIDANGTLKIPALDIELTAQQIPADEAAGLAKLLALAAATDDRPLPGATGDMPWDAFSDAEGGLRPEARPTTAGTAAVTGAETSAPPRPVATAGAADIPTLHLAQSTSWPTQSILPLALPTYLEHTAATEDDIDVLGPRTTEVLRDDVEGADPELDAELAAWHDPNCTRPKIRLLGPVAVTAQGELPAQSPRLSWNTEVVAYLATRPTGVSAERFGTDLWPGEPDIAGKTKVRQAVMIARKWLGESPDGHEYLPKGTTASVNGGIARYEITDALVDAELFRRLRLRGLARGAGGIDDLWAALDLVDGIPFDARRPGGYSWLADDPLDHYFAGMIADTANTVATHHLAAGEPRRAAAAAQVALRAGSSEDTPLLNLMLACDAQGNRAEGDVYKLRIMANHDAEVEEDLPPHTFLVLNRRDRAQAS